VRGQYIYRAACQMEGSASGGGGGGRNRGSWIHFDHRPTRVGDTRHDERSVMKEGHSLAVGPGPNKRGERLPSGAERLLTMTETDEAMVQMNTTALDRTGIDDWFRGNDGLKMGISGRLGTCPAGRRDVRRAKKPH